MQTRNIRLRRTSAPPQARVRRGDPFVLRFALAGADGKTMYLTGVEDEYTLKSGISNVEVAGACDVAALEDSIAADAQAWERVITSLYHCHLEVVSILLDRGLPVHLFPCRPELFQPRDKDLCEEAKAVLCLFIVHERIGVVDLRAYHYDIWETLVTYMIRGASLRGAAGAHLSQCPCGIRIMKENRTCLRCHLRIKASCTHGTCRPCPNCMVKFVVPGADAGAAPPDCGHKSSEMGGCWVCIDGAIMKALEPN